MDKVLLMSVIAATMLAPTLAARDVVPVRGIKRALLFLVVFFAAYLAALVLVYIKFYVPEWSP
jgi:hypothetical protein